MTQATETYQAHLLKLQGAKCPTCGDDIAGAGKVTTPNDFNGFSTVPCPDCQATGFRNLGLRPKCTPPTGGWHWVVGAVREGAHPNTLDICECNGTGVTLPPEAELTGVLMEMLAQELDAPSSLIRAKLVIRKLKNGWWVCPAGDRTNIPLTSLPPTLNAALAAALAKAQGPA